MCVRWSKFLPDAYSWCKFCARELVEFSQIMFAEAESVSGSVRKHCLPHDAMRARYSSSLFAYTSYAENTARFRTPLLQKSIGISCPPRTRRRLQSCSNGFAAASHAGTERRADIVPFHRHRPCTAHSAGSTRNSTRMNNFLPSCVRHTRTML